MVDNRISCEKTSFILNKGIGVKCLLFDDTTKVILSNLIPHSKFLDSDFFLFESIISKRTKLEGVSCVVVISPSTIKSLIEEITNPCYSSYTILFINQVDPLMLEILARNDVYGVVEEVHEIYLDYYKQEENLYTLEKDNFNGVISSLYSFVISLKSIPTIYYVTELTTLTESLNNRLSIHKLDEGGQMFILNREYDIITPLLYDWRYQGMIKQFLSYNHQMVELPGTESSTNVRKFTLTDDFFENNKFKDLNFVSEEIKEKIKTVDIKKKMKKLNLEEIRELSSLSETIYKHMSIHKNLLSDGIKILEISEMEYAILQKKTPEDLENTLQNKEIDVKIRSKLLLIYVLKNNIRNKDYLMKFPDLKTYIDKFLSTFDFTDPKYLKNTNLTRNYNYSFNKEIDPKLGYIPPIRRLLRHIMTRKVKDGVFDVSKERLNKGRYTILYFHGGVTMAEYREIMEAVGVANTNIYIVADRIISYNDILSP